MAGEIGVGTNKLQPQQNAVESEGDDRPWPLAGARGSPRIAGRRTSQLDLTYPVCTKNSVLIDYVTESPNVSGDDRFVVLFPDPDRLAVQVEETT